MYYDDDTGAVTFMSGVLFGALLGASVALLLAPNAGKKTRRKLIRGLSSAREEATGRWDDISDEVRSAVEAGRKKVRI